MYEIRHAGAKGLGVFASSHIPRGTRIFSERPLIAITQAQDAGDIFSASRLLSVKDRGKLLGLSSHTTTELSILRWNQTLWHTLKYTLSALSSLKIPKLTSIKEHVTILSIFRSNSFNLGSKSAIQQAVFSKISRINHSCLPNAQGNFHEGLGRFNIHATRDIATDEEVTLNYLHDHGAIREARMGRLSSGYGFDCGCPACDLSTTKGIDGEKRRVKMLGMLGEYAQGVENGSVKGVESELLIVEAFIRLMEGEGVAGHGVSVL
jgi:hypothetical protein